MSCFCSSCRWVSWKQLSRAVSAAVLRAVLQHQQEIIRVERACDDSLALEKYFPDDICVVDSVAFRFCLEADQPNWWERLRAFLCSLFYPRKDRHTWYRLAAGCENTVLLTLSIKGGAEGCEIEVKKSPTVPDLNSLRIRI